MILDYKFSNKIIEYYNFPNESKADLLTVQETIKSNFNLEKEYIKVISDYFVDSIIDIYETRKLLKQLADKYNLDEYLFDLTFVINCMPFAYNEYAKRGINEQIFWDSFKDMEYKNAECISVYGKTGTFVFEWYDGFLKLNRFSLGRFQFEQGYFQYEDTVLKNGFLIHEGDSYLNFHIPSSGVSITENVRLESFKIAYGFFGQFKNNGKMIFGCRSYLLHPSCKNIFSPSSNLMSFYNDFDIVDSFDAEFEDGWRIFGDEYNKPYDELPQKTSLQKAYVQFLKSGESAGVGDGYFVFDGEKIIK